MNKIAIYDPKSIKALEKKVASMRGISTDELVFDAGNRLFEDLMDLNIIQNHDRILVIIGSGNNGMDAYVLGLYLEIKGLNVTYVFTHYAQKHHEARNKMHLPNADTIIDPSFIKPCMFDIIIDGLFGIGLNRNLDKKATQLIHLINENKAFIISIDLPSGIHGHHGLKMPIAVNADLTLVCHAYKTAHFLGDAQDFSKKTIVVDFGYGNLKNHSLFLRIPEETIYHPTRLHHTHKYDYGHVLIIGGSKMMLGAPILAAHAAFRSGAGLVSWLLEKRYDRATQELPDVMKGMYDSQSQLLESIQKKSSIVFGPGLGKEDNIAHQSLSDLIDKKIPMVIDADGISDLKNINSKVSMSHLVMTPHIIEFSRLIEIKPDVILLDPIRYLKSYPNQDLNIVLKGPCTLIKMGSEIIFLPIGHPGLATAGTGDVLSGILGTMMARYEIKEAIFKALMLFHEASMMAKNMFGEESMVASDLIEAIPKILKRGEKDGDNTNIY